MVIAHAPHVPHPSGVILILSCAAAGSLSSFAAGLTGTLAALLKGAGGGLATHGSNLALLFRVHGSEAAVMAGLTALGGNLPHLILWPVGKVTRVGACRAALAAAAVRGVSALGGNLAQLVFVTVGKVTRVGVRRASLAARFGALATTMGSVSALGRNLTQLVLIAVGEVAGVGGCHCGSVSVVKEFGVV